MDGAASAVGRNACLGFRGALGELGSSAGTTYVIRMAKGLEGVV